MNSPSHSPSEIATPDRRSGIRNILLATGLFAASCEGDKKATDRVDIPETVETERDT